MAPSRLVPWISWDEWDEVREWLLHRDSHDIERGIERVAAWKSRGKLPLAVEITSEVRSIELRDPALNPGCVGALSEELLRMLMAMAILRLVNGVADQSQKGRFAQSVADLAHAAGLPRLLVDIRHEAAHNELPSLALLRLGLKQALCWLEQHYWDAQKGALVQAREKLRQQMWQFACLLNFQRSEAGERVHQDVYEHVATKVEEEEEGELEAEKAQRKRLSLKRRRKAVSEASKRQHRALLKELVDAAASPGRELVAVLLDHGLLIPSTDATWQPEVWGEDSLHSSPGSIQGGDSLAPEQRGWGDMHAWQPRPAGGVGAGGRSNRHDRGLWEAALKRLSELAPFLLPLLFGETMIRLKAAFEMPGGSKGTLANELLRWSEWLLREAAPKPMCAEAKGTAPLSSGQQQKETKGGQQKQGRKVPASPGIGAGGSATSCPKGEVGQEAMREALRVCFEHMDRGTPLIRDVMAHLVMRMQGGQKQQSHLLGLLHGHGLADVAAGGMAESEPDASRSGEAAGGQGTQGDPWQAEEDMMELSERELARVQQIGQDELTPGLRHGGDAAAPLEGVAQGSSAAKQANFGPDLELTPVAPGWEDGNLTAEEVSLSIGLQKALHGRRWRMADTPALADSDPPALRLIDGGIREPRYPDPGPTGHAGARPGPETASDFSGASQKTPEKGDAPASAPLRWTLMTSWTPCAIGHVPSPFHHLGVIPHLTLPAMPVGRQELNQGVGKEVLLTGTGVEPGPGPAAAPNFRLEDNASMDAVACKPEARQRAEAGQDSMGWWHSTALQAEREAAEAVSEEDKNDLPREAQDAENVQLKQLVHVASNEPDTRILDNVPPERFLLQGGHCVLISPKQIDALRQSVRLL